MQINDILQGGYHSPLLREWQQSNPLTCSNLMYPIFITDNTVDEDITAMPGQVRMTLDSVVGHLKPLVEKGLKSILIFGVIVKGKKDSIGSLANTPDGVVISAVKLLKKTFPKLIIACDVCLCPFTDHGHCGLFKDDTLDTLASCKRLADIAVDYAKAGADIVAPSDMMDGRIRHIKQGLIDNNLQNKCTLMAYSAKFASCFYGPFRQAAGTTPSFGDRRSYQLPPGSSNLAKRAIERDYESGADIIMVKPGMPYLDIVKMAKDLVPVPIAVYHVSGEYSMLWFAAQNGVLDLKDAVMESMTAFLRAGANIIITYYTPYLLDVLNGTDEKK